jgi:hypothetical protein
MMRSIIIVGMMLASATAMAVQSVQPLPDAASLAWGKWTFDYKMGDAHSEGLTLLNVRWKGTTVLYKASLPVIRVKYRGNGSSIDAGYGPWLDRISSANLSFVNNQFTKVVMRVFGDTLEIACFAEIGGYDLYQAWYFSESGRLQPMLYSSGWSTSDTGAAADHRHHPYWRLDFDVEGPENEVWEIRTKTAGAVTTQKYAIETDAHKFFQTDDELAWTINKPGSSKHVTIRYPHYERIDVGGTPWFGFSDRDASVRRFHSSENGWESMGTDDLGLASSAESVDGKDVVFWAINHLTHTWTVNDAVLPDWHFTGPVIDVSW